MIAALLLIPMALAGQETGVLHVTVTLVDRTGQPTPVARHALLISDNPATAAPRHLRTAADGTLEVKLRPGTYTVESDRAVMFQGTAYEWFQMADVVAGQKVTLELTTGNAEIDELAEPSESAAARPASDPMFLFGTWHDSIVSIWSATTLATGFIVDSRGLIATHRQGAGNATTVDVQLSDALKVPGRVLFSDVSQDVAVVWVNPAAIAGLPPLALDCPTTQAPSLSEGDEIMTIVSELRRPKDLIEGVVTALHARAAETDLRLASGAAGGPVFNAAGAVVGLTSVRVDPETGRSSDAEIVRTVNVCAALSAAQAKLAGATPPEATPLPVEPTRAFPASALEESNTPARTGASAGTVISEDFEITFVTPVTIHQAQQKADWTGGASIRSPETEARLGRLTDFGAWSEYFFDAPPVVVVRVTPKMVEGFWKRVAREAARTQGAELPPFKHFRTSFARMALSCGGKAIAPIHPFVLEHQLSENDVLREGLYVFDPETFGPQCGEMSLTLHSEKAPGKGDTMAIAPAVTEHVWNDFAAWRDEAR